MKSVMKISDTVIVFRQIMKGLLAYQKEVPNILLMEDIAEIAIQLTRLEMEQKAKEVQAEIQSNTYELMMIAIRAYIDTLKLSSPSPFPFPMPEQITFTTGENADPDIDDRIGENKNSESDAKPVPEHKG